MFCERKKNMRDLQFCLGLAVHSAFFGMTFCATFFVRILVLSSRSTVP